MMMIMSRMLLSLLCFVALVYGQPSPDTAPMFALRDSLKATKLNWSDPNPCVWTGLGCDSTSHRVTRIQIGNRGISGTLTSDLRNLSSLTVFEVMGNNLTGKIPSRASLKSLERVLLNDNGFTMIGADFFTGLNSLHYVNLDNNPMHSWELPFSLTDANSLLVFSAVNCNLSGKIPDFLWNLTFPNLTSLDLSGNHLIGELPMSFADSRLQILKLDGQELNGSISVLEKMPVLTEVSLHGNRFSGTLPDFYDMTSLQVFNVSNNQLKGFVSYRLMALTSLSYVALGNNLLQGATPNFRHSRAKNCTFDMTGLNSFCLNIPGASCDPRISALLFIVQEFGFPTRFGESWKGNDPCNSSITWLGITCTGAEITAINFQDMGLTGTIPRSFVLLKSLEVINLAHNNLTTYVPYELSTLSNLVSYNHFMYGHVPQEFRPNVVVTTGDPYLTKVLPGPVSAPCAPSSAGKIVACVIGVVFGLLLIGFAVFLYVKKRKQYNKMHLQKHSGASESGNHAHVVL